VGELRMAVRVWLDAVKMLNTDNFTRNWWGGYVQAAFEPAPMRLMREPQPSFAAATEVPQL
jgi:hypothetical protein